MVSWPQPGARVTVRYRRPAGSVPPLTDAVGHLLGVEPVVRVQTKTGTVVQFAPTDAVAVRVLSDAPVRTSQIRALEHAAALAWPGVEQLWLDGWLLRAGHGVTSRANSAVPLDVSATSAAIPALVGWYTRRGLTPRLAIADRLLRVPGVGEQANAAACSSARTCEVRTGASLSARTATTSAGANCTTAPVFVRTRTSGSMASRWPTASVRGGTDPTGRR